MLAGLAIGSIGTVSVTTMPAKRASSSLRSPSAERRAWVTNTQTSVAPLLAETIMNVFADDSVSAIFGGENQLF